MVSKAQDFEYLLFDLECVIAEVVKDAGKDRGRVSRVCGALMDGLKAAQREIDWNE